MMVVFPAAGVASVRLGPGGTNVATEFRAVELGHTFHTLPGQTLL